MSGKSDGLEYRTPHPLRNSAAVCQDSVIAKIRTLAGMPKWVRKERPDLDRRLFDSHYAVVLTLC